MGNAQVIDNNNINPSSKLTKNNELLQVHAQGQQFAQEEYLETENCCGFQFKKKIKRKIYWQNNFISNCSIFKQEYKWAQELIDLITIFRQSKLLYFREVNDLKKLMVFKSQQQQRDVIMSPAQLQQFKLNIKKSVLISSSQTSKFFQESPNKIIMGPMNNQGRLSKIQIQKFRNTIMNKSPVKKRQSSISSSKSGLRKSIMSFVDDTLSSVFGNQRQISKKTAADLEIFLKFCMILEKHFNDPNCILFKIKRRFTQFLIKNYGDSADISKIDELIDSVNQFMLIMKEVLIDYYNLKTYSNDGPYSNNFITNQQNIISLCNSIFFKDNNFYQTLFNFIARYNEERQSKLQNIINLLQNQQPSKFYIKDNFCLNYKTIKIGLKDNENIKTQGEYIIDEEPYKSCKLILNQLQTSKSPVNKMKIILNVSEMMNKNIERFYQVNGLQRQKWMLDADQVLSIFCYIIVGSKIKNIFTHLFILDHFSTSSQMISIFGYYLSVMNCAVQQLENDYLQKLQNQSFQ